MTGTMGRGADKVEQLAAGTPAATGERPRQPIEAASSGNLDTALASVPPGAREGVATAAREGFLTGMNEILMLGGILAFAGALVSLWLVREPRRGAGAPRSVEPAADGAGFAIPTRRLTHQSTG